MLAFRKRMVLLIAEGFKERAQERAKRIRGMRQPSRHSGGSWSLGAFHDRCYKTSGFRCLPRALIRGSPK